MLNNEILVYKTKGNKIETIYLTHFKGVELSKKKAFIKRKIKSNVYLLHYKHENGINHISTKLIESNTEGLPYTQTTISKSHITLYNVNKTSIRVFI